MADITHAAPYSAARQCRYVRADTLARLLHHLRSAYADYRALRRKIRRLDDLSDDQLRDIGLRRNGTGGGRIRPLGGDPVAMYPRHSGLGAPLGR